MPKLWSELPRPRTIELAADIATAAWVALWLKISWEVFSRLASFASGVGQIREGGVALESAGIRVGEALALVPVIGGAAGDLVRVAFSATAAPFITAGGSLEAVIRLIASILGLLVLVVPTGPALTRYFPWRLRRVRTLDAAHRVIRASGAATRAAEVQQLLASRALHRLSYAELRAYSPDPFGDWLAGRYDRLARAEAASVGLRLR